MDVVDVSAPAPVVTGQIKVGLHPNKSVLSPDGKTLYVANGDADSVSQIDLAAAKVARTLSLSPYKNAPVGSNPTGLALDGDGKQLFVTNSGNNDVSVIDLEKGKADGVIPTAWYPSAVVWDDGRLHVLNAKGLGAGPNDGPGELSRAGVPGPRAVRRRLRHDVRHQHCPHPVVRRCLGRGRAYQPRRRQQAPIGYSLRHFAEDIVTFMDAGGIPSAVLVGSSSGGYVAQHVALTSPRRAGPRWRPHPGTCVASDLIIFIESLPAGTPDEP